MTTVPSRVRVHIDRPLGSRHPKYKDMVYPVNYGYVPNILGGDGQEQDVYLLGIAEPCRQFEGKVIAVIHRRDDCESKWVVVPEGTFFSEDEIKEAVAFQEQYFDSWIELLKS
ncbi:inorganic diphosphatase [Streptococcus plurextorum]|uniref:inorganic diphosphatase n=1 Tax=Streptococcus plurextorum TaxID=456876 RepID=UPI00040EE7AB|nr:inorganic diphosphatase [Streptococcus plurextorum]